MTNDTEAFNLDEARKLADELEEWELADEVRDLDIIQRESAAMLRAACVEIERTKDRDWLAQLLAETRDEMSGRVERMNEITRTLTAEVARLKEALESEKDANQRLQNERRKVAVRIEHSHECNYATAERKAAPHPY